MTVPTTRSDLQTLARERLAHGTDDAGRARSVLAARLLQVDTPTMLPFGDEDETV